MWDPILQAGKTPQVTQDINLNPLMVGEEITGGLNVYLDTAGNTAYTGTELSLTDAFFDYVGADAVTIACSIGAGSTTESRIIADIGKNINLRGITFYFQYTRAGAGYPNFGAYVETSEDGSTWREENSTAPSTGTRVNVTLSSKQTKARYIRIRFFWNGAASSPTTVYLKKLRVWSDSIQRFY